MQRVIETAVVDQEVCHGAERHEQQEKLYLQRISAIENSVVEGIRRTSGGAWQAWYSCASSEHAEDSTDQPLSTPRVVKCATVNSRKMLPSRRCGENRQSGKWRRKALRVAPARHRIPFAQAGRVNQRRRAAAFESTTATACHSGINRCAIRIASGKTGNKQSHTRDPQFMRITMLSEIEKMRRIPAFPNT